MYSAIRQLRKILGFAQLRSYPIFQLRLAARPILAVAIGLAACLSNDLGRAELPNESDAPLAPVVSATQIRQKQRSTRPSQTAAIVCAPNMLPVMAEWRQLRLRQGINTVHVDSRLPTPEIRTALQLVARKHPLRFVVLVGDADAQMAYAPQVRAQSVPTFYYEANVIKRYGPEEVIATDNPFGDLDGDGVPELAVGRLTAESPAELQQIIDKILFYESLPANGTWRRRMHFTAGVGDFGAITDAVVETAAKRFVTDGIPPDYRVTLAYGSWRSPYCPDPRAFRESLLGSLQEGCLFWVYMGHGRPYRLDRIQIGDSVLPILESSDIPRMNTQAGLPIAIMMACYTGAFDQPLDCLAERMLRTPRGPVAVICGSRVTMPYPMSILGTALMDGYFEQRYETLGELLLYAKRELASETGTDSSQRKMLDALARTLSPGKVDLAAERAEHQLIFHLLGDPTLRLKHPEPISVECEEAVEAGQTLEIQGNSTIGGTCLVELCCRRDGFISNPTRRRQQAKTDDELVSMSHTYRKSNNRLWASRQIELRPGPFTVQLQVPENARGFSHARVFLQNDGGYGMGSSPVYIRAKELQAELRQSNADR